MKRGVVFVFIAALSVLSLSALEPGLEAVKLDGTLEAENGRIVMRNGKETYVIHGLGPLLGFVEGLKEGASVNLEGYVSPRYQDYYDGGFNILRVTKVSLGNKSYELPFRRDGFRFAEGGPGPFAGACPRFYGYGYGQGQGYSRGERHMPRNYHGHEYGRPRRYF